MESVVPDMNRLPSVSLLPTDTKGRKNWLCVLWPPSCSRYDCRLENVNKVVISLCWDPKLYDSVSFRVINNNGSFVMRARVDEQSYASSGIGQGDVYNASDWDQGSFQCNQISRNVNATRPNLIGNGHVYVRWDAMRSPSRGTS